ncbi:MAG: hypothetical protein AMJ54_00535 [Deltaproteobacteria bacterium SG8_13]|nr:MAG: hypothetical protein AMJ54_00535 [Deltaproteobacteria bacterium SG8_13]
MKTERSHTLASTCRLYVGTSGYSYTDWTEAGFYPPGSGRADMIDLYAQRFPITELNHTWYQLPRAETIERQRRRVPLHFRFAAKLTRSLTHEIDFQRRPVLASGYRDGVAPLTQTRQLTAVLVQLPSTFDRTLHHRRLLAALLDMLRDLPLAVEFRHRSWAEDRVLQELERRRIALVVADGPQLPDRFPDLAAVTNPELFYVRFYGRSARGWVSGKTSHQFDYSYSEEQLREWIEDRIALLGSRARTGILFFANHTRAQAPKNALRMMALLRERGMAVV